MKSDGIKPEGGDIIPKKTHLAFDDVIKLVDGPSASRMLVVFGATILGIVLIIIIHCCRVLSRKQKEDADYLKRLQTKDNLPKSLPPGCCELSNSVFFETLCCLGVIKDNIKKERNEINVDQLVSELKLAKSLSMTMSKNASKLVSDGKRSKHSLRPSRSRRPSEQRISMQQRSQLDFKPSTNGGKKDDSYVINVEGNETFADRTKLDGDQAESPKDSLRSLPLLKEAIRQSNNHVKCSCGKIIASESKNKRPSSEGFKAQQQLHPSASSRISFTDGSVRNGPVTQKQRSLQSVSSQQRSDYREFQHPSPSRQTLTSLSRHEVERQSRHGSEQQNGSELRLETPLQRVPQMATRNESDHRSVGEPIYGYSTPIPTSRRGSYHSNISKSRKISAETQTTPTFLSPIEQIPSPGQPPLPQEPPTSQSRLIRVDKAQNVPSFASNTGVPPQSEFVRVDKAQNFPSFASNTGPPSQSEFVRVEKAQNLSSFASNTGPPSQSEFVRVDKAQNFPSFASNTGPPSQSEFVRVEKAQNFPSFASNTGPPTQSEFVRVEKAQNLPSFASNTGPPSQSHFVRVKNAQNFPSLASDISPVYGVHPSRSTDYKAKIFSFDDYAMDGLREMQENNSHTSSHNIARSGVTLSQQRSGTRQSRAASKPSTTALRQRDLRSYSDRDEQLKESYIIRPEKSSHYLQDRLVENQYKPSFHSEINIRPDRENSQPKQEFSYYEEYVPTKRISEMNDNEWPVENFPSIGSRIDARRSYSQPAVFRKSEVILDPGETYYNNNYPDKYFEHQDNREHIVMPIYKVPNTPPLPNPYQTTYREHFGMVNNRTRVRPNRQLVDSGIEVNGSRDSGERNHNVPSRSPHSQYQQALANHRASTYGSGRRKEREFDFESRSSSRDGRHSRGPSTSNEPNLENDQEVLKFLKERRSVSGFMEAKRESPQEARRSRFNRYVQERRSAPSSSVVPSDNEEQYIDDPQNDDRVLEYLRQKKTVSALIDDSRQTMPIKFVRDFEERRQPNVPVSERDRENDEEVLYYLRHRRSISGGRSDENEGARERVMQNVREDFEYVGPRSLETMADINQELKYTKMFAKNTTQYPPAAAKIGERKDIKVPITSRNVFSPPPSNRGSPQQRREAQDEGPSTPYQEYLRRSMIRWPVKDIDIRRSRDALKGNRLQELLNKDGDQHANQRESRHSGNNNNIESSAYIYNSGEEFLDDSEQINQREQIEYNDKPFSGRNKAEENEFLQQVKKRGNDERVMREERTQQRGRRPRTSTGDTRDRTLNETRDYSSFTMGGSDSGLYERGAGPKHSTPKPSPEQRSTWERRNSSGSLLEVMRNSPTIQNKFFSRSENMAHEDFTNVDIWKTDIDSRAGRRRSREQILQNQQRDYQNEADHAISRPDARVLPNSQTLSSLQGMSSERLHSRVSEAFLGPQSLLGDRRQTRKASFIGYHKSNERARNGHRYHDNMDTTFDSNESIPRTPPPPPNF
ncbi:uncharacterized protein [Magallana gigas]|uniref:uncharacterized protein n=1 Tax=Magallana gigas TaxID=29159 RepID=UPI00333E86BA